MHPREQGRRRSTAVTVGLAAASLAGTVAVGAAAQAKSGDSGEGGTPAPTPGPTQSEPATPDGLPPGPDLPGPTGQITEDTRPPVVKSAGS